MSSNPVYDFFTTRGGFAPLVLRMTLATVFFYHGTRKAFGWFDGDGWVATMTLWAKLVDFSQPMASAIIIVELLIPISLFFGFLTRLGALAAAVISAGAIYYFNDGTFESMELSIVLLAAALSLVATGGGWLSVDRGIGAQLLPSVG